LRKDLEKESHYAEPRPTRILFSVFIFIKFSNCLLRRWLYRQLPEKQENPLSDTREEMDRQLEKWSILDHNIRRELPDPEVTQHSHSWIPHKPPGDEDVAKEAQYSETTSE
jgi:hypothetical protein